MYNRRLYIAELKTDMRYQSPVKDSQVRKIVKNFNLNKMDAIVVNKRSDNSFYIIDGQHRVEALKELGIHYVDANVYTNLTPEEEAEKYYGVNDRPSKTPVNKAKSKLMFKEQTAIEIDKAVINAGLKVDYEGKAPSNGYILAYGTLEFIHKKYGKNFLEIVLTVINQSFGDERRNYQSFMLRGFTQFLSTYGDKLDVQNLIERLQGTGYEGFMKEVNKNKNGFNTKKECLPLALADIYNKKKRSDNRLDKRLLFA